MRQFAHPMNGYVEKVGPLSLVLTFLLGPFFLIYRRAWLAAVLYPLIGALAFLAEGALFAPPYALIYPLLSPFRPMPIILVWLSVMLLTAWALQPLVSKSYLRRGWREELPSRP